MLEKVLITELQSRSNGVLMQDKSDRIHLWGSHYLIMQHHPCFALHEPPTHSARHLSCRLAALHACCWCDPNKSRGRHLVTPVPPEHGGLTHSSESADTPTAFLPLCTFPTKMWREKNEPSLCFWCSASCSGLNQQLWQRRRSELQDGGVTLWWQVRGRHDLEAAVWGRPGSDLWCLLVKAPPLPSTERVAKP